MKAPEKIYLTKNLLGELQDGWDAQPSEELFNVEYTRTDAFIEKACEFLFENYHGEKLSLRMINDFKTYMKGE